ncbi:MAG: metallophosphoesterase [Pseudomonadales bacterium]
MSRRQPWRLLQITDLHLRAEAGVTLLGVDTQATLDAVLEQVLAEAAPDALLLTGDLAHDPDPAAYRRLQRQLDARCPVPRLVLPGNHDLGAPLAEVFGQADSLRLGGWTVIGFDTHVDDRPEGSLDAAARDHLAVRLEAAGTDHVLLACHHPPLPVGAPWLDKDRLADGESLLESWRARGSVRALAYGHVHQQVDVVHHGLTLLATPSTCFQFEPGSRRFAIDRSADSGRPGYRWLELHADGRVRTEVGRCDLTLNIDLTDGP